MKKYPIDSYEGKNHCEDTLYEWLGMKREETDVMDGIEVVLEFEDELKKAHIKENERLEKRKEQIKKFIKELKALRKMMEDDLK